MTTTTTENYDPFTGPDLDLSKWQFLQYPIPGGEPWVCREPQSHISFADGRMSLEIEAFELQHPVQSIDNCKFVLLSSTPFDVPATGKLVVTAKMSGDNIAGTPFNWRDGFASLIVIDLSTGLVFDVIQASQGVGAIHEQLPLSEDTIPFTHVTEAPLAAVSTGSGHLHECRITLDAADHTVTWDVDGTEIFRAQGIDVPTSVNLGLGVFTLHPVVDGESRSLHGQGFKASWSDIRVTTA